MCHVPSWTGAVQQTDLFTKSNLLHVGLNVWGQVGLASSNRGGSTQLKVSYGRTCMPSEINSTSSNCPKLHTLTDQLELSMQGWAAVQQLVLKHCLCSQDDSTAAKHWQSEGQRDKALLLQPMRCRTCHKLRQRCYLRTQSRRRPRCQTYPPGTYIASSALARVEYATLEMNENQPQVLCQAPCVQS